MAKEKEERERKASLKTIPLSKLEVGGIYKTTSDMLYMYLGKRKVVFEDLCSKIEEIKEGNCFVYIYSIEGRTDKDILDRLLDIRSYNGGSHNVDILKGNKKFTEIVRKVDLEFPLEKIYESPYRWHNEKFKLTVE